MRGWSMMAGAIVVAGVFASPPSSAWLRAAGGPAAQAKPKPKPGPKPMPSTEASVKAGAAMFAKLCRSCHGLQAKGDGIAAPPGSKPANLIDAEWKHGGTDAEIFATIRNGVAPFEVMKPQKLLTDAEVWSLVHYLRSLALKQKK
jgi:mono/diheme cytochrome c family protein